MLCFPNSENIRNREDTCKASGVHTLGSSKAASGQQGGCRAALQLQEQQQGPKGCQAVATGVVRGQALQLELHAGTSRAAAVKDLLGRALLQQSGGRLCCGIRGHVETGCLIGAV